MKAKVYVHRIIAAQNKKNNKDDPCITVRTHKSIERAHEVMFTGPAKLVTVKDNKGDPSVWIEAQRETITLIIREKTDEEMGYLTPTSENGWLL